MCPCTAAPLPMASMAGAGTPVSESWEHWESHQQAMPAAGPILLCQCFHLSPEKRSSELPVPGRAEPLPWGWGSHEPSAGAVRVRAGWEDVSDKPRLGPCPCGLRGDNCELEETKPVLGMASRADDVGHGSFGSLAGRGRAGRLPVFLSPGSAWAPLAVRGTGGFLPPV